MLISCKKKETSRISLIKNGSLVAASKSVPPIRFLVYETSRQLSEVRLAFSQKEVKSLPESFFVRLPQRSEAAKD